MLIFSQEFTLCFGCLWIRKTHLSFVQRELLCRSSDLKLWPTKHTLGSSFVLHNDRFLLCQGVLFIISFLSHLVFDFRSTSYRLDFFRLYVEISFSCFRKVKWSLVIPRRLFVLKLLKDISLYWCFLSDLSTFNERLDQTIWLLEVRFFEANEALNCILALACSKRIALELGCERSWVHLLWMRHTCLGNWPLFHMLIQTVVLRSIEISRRFVITCCHCNRSSWTNFRNWSKAGRASI